MLGQRPTTLEWLLDALERRNLIDAATRRDLEVQAPAQRARVQKQNTSEHDIELVDRYQVSAAELVASFHVLDPTGGEIDGEMLAALIAAESGLAYHKIDPLELDMALITRTLSRPFAVRHVVVPISATDGKLVVAVEDPFDLELVESLARIATTAVERVVASKQDIIKAIVEVYGFRKSVESAAQQKGSEELGDFEQLVRLRSVGELEATDQHIVNAVDFLLRYAFDQRASDIHIEPRRGDSQVRLRIDGVLHDTHSVPRRVHPSLTARIKAMSRMDIAEKRRPQDGRIKTVMADREIELRVSTLPTAFGEKTVIRIFDPQILLQGMPDLGFDPDDLDRFTTWLERPNGMILITGPTGSGKTTTLYTTLKSLATETVNVTTIEDPIEMITDAFNQVAVQPKIGVDFASALRSILRQDPDIIMVGEIRDAATAEMAAQAALTGHLVFSTLHTNDTVGAVTRLVDLGVPRFLITSTVVGVMAQRLVRRICAACHTPTPLSADQLISLSIAPKSPEAARFAHAAAGTGCIECRGTGYRGRVGLFELLDIDADFADAILAETPENELRRAAVLRGVRSLRQCALARLGEGITTYEEVMRVTGAAATGSAGLPEIPAGDVIPAS